MKALRIRLRAGTLVGAALVFGCFGCLAQNTATSHGGDGSTTSDAGSGNPDGGPGGDPFDAGPGGDPLDAGPGSNQADGGPGSDPVDAGSGFDISSPLTLDKQTIERGETLNASVTYKNFDSVAVGINEVVIAARPPGGTHAGGPYLDLAPTVGARSVPASGTVQVDASRAFSDSDPLGTWEVYSTYQDADENWHDGPSLFVTVTAPNCVAESDAAFCTRLGRNCDSVSAADNCGTARSVDCGSCTSPQTCGGGGMTNVCGSPGSSSMKIGVNFWNKNWGNGWRDYFASGVNWSTTTNPWNPQFLQELAPYSVLRFMDWGPTNDSNVSTWSQRVSKTADHYTSDGVAIEWMIDLCNRTGKDMWYTVPHLANQAYLNSLATLIRDTLNPSLKVYIEYSNETWNDGIGSQAQYVENQGTSMGMPGSNQWYRGGAFTVYKAFQVFKAFRDVFQGQMATRVVRVLSYSGNEDVFRQGYLAVVGSSQYNPDNETCDMIAVAPYVGSGLNGSSGSIQSGFHNAVDSTENGYVATAVSIANSFGKPLGTYEGGQHLLNNADQWSRNSAIYNEYTYMLDRWSTHFTLFMQYTQYGTWASGGAWGAKESLTQPLSDAHKYRAIVDWRAAHP